LFCGSAELPQGLKPLLVRSVGSAKAEALAYPEAKAERFSVQLRVVSKDSAERTADSLAGMEARKASASARASATARATARATANAGVLPLRLRSGSRMTAKNKQQQQQRQEQATATATATADSLREWKTRKASATASAIATATQFCCLFLCSGSILVNWCK